MALTPGNAFDGDGRRLPVTQAMALRHCDELFAMWTAARAEANAAYDGWRSEPSRDAYLAYRAAEERADAAQDALAEAWGRRPARPGFHAAA